MQAAHFCPAQTAAYQPAPTTSTPKASANTSDFQTEQSLTGNEETDAVVSGLLLVLVQLLMQQFGSNQQQSSDQDSSTEGELDFNETDRDHLLNALETDTTNKQVGTVSDSDASNHLTQGDDVELISPTSTELHDITNTEVQNFIALRNPAGTPTLPLTPQQEDQIAAQFNLTNVSVSDNNGDGVVSSGDHVTGEQTIAGRQFDVDILLTDDTANSLNS